MNAWQLGWEVDNQTSRFISKCQITNGLHLESTASDATRTTPDSMTAYSVLCLHLSYLMTDDTEVYAYDMTR